MYYEEMQTLSPALTLLLSAFAHLAMRCSTGTKPLLHCTLLLRSSRYLYL